MTENKKTLAEVRALAPETKFVTVGLVTAFKEKRDKNDKPYWTMSVMDTTGDLEAKIWGNAQWWDVRTSIRQEITTPSGSDLVANIKGQVIGLTGQVSEFKGKPQYHFNQIYLVDQSKKEYDPAGFLREAGVSLDNLESQFREVIGECKGEAGDFLRFVFDFNGELWEEFKNYPAAVSHHHAYVHGLLEHTLGVAKCARAMAESYQEAEAKPDIDVVIAGACLHDLGKLDTYLLNPMPAMTLDGTVIDHIASGYVRFCKLADEFKLTPMMKTILGHIILSHHGQKEFGSPVLPATPEAMIVAAADNLDFLINCWQNSVELLDGGEEPEHAISDFDFSAQRRFWKWRPIQTRQ